MANVEKVHFLVSPSVVQCIRQSIIHGLGSSQLLIIYNSALVGWYTKSRSPSRSCLPIQVTDEWVCRPFKWGFLRDRRRRQNEGWIMERSSSHFLIQSASLMDGLVGWGDVTTGGSNWVIGHTQMITLPRLKTYLFPDFRPKINVFYYLRINVRHEGWVVGEKKRHKSLHIFSIHTVFLQSYFV